MNTPERFTPPIQESSVNILDDLKMIGGSSVVGHLSDYHPHKLQSDTTENDPAYFKSMTPVNGTIEYYSGIKDSRAVLGALGTKWYQKEISPDLQYLDVFDGEAGGIFADLSQAYLSFWDSKELQGITRGLGMEFDVRENSESKQYVGTALQSCEDINSRLAILGIHDREFVEFDGDMFDAKTYLRLLRKHKIPIASKGKSAVHDRVLHLVGHVLLAPEVLDVLAYKAGTLVDDLKTAEDLIGGRPYYVFDGDEPSKYFAAKGVASKFMGKLDYNIPLISFAISNQSRTKTHIERQVAHHLEELGISDKAQQSELTLATLEWIDKLKLNANNTNN